jgi:ERCC4-type nuclease
MTRKESLKELRTIPGVGKSIAQNLWRLGFRSVEDLAGRDPEELYKKLGARKGADIDRCLLYVMRCAVYYASHKRHDPEKLKWWSWKDKRSIV